MSEQPARNRVIDEIGKWITHINELPGFTDFKRAHLRATLYHGDPFLSDDTDRPAEAFAFPPLVEKRHRAVMSYFALYNSYQALADTEFYFRRYPFHDLPISKDNHLRYVCEMYFSRMYEFSERMKVCLNSLKAILDVELQVGAVIKRFAREFRSELKARNQIHHHDRFDDILLDKIGLLGMMALSDKENGKKRGWDKEHERAYRMATKEWAARAKRRSAAVALYLDAIAEVIIEHCRFLSEPIARDTEPVGEMEEPALHEGVEPTN